jgi:predicted nuclease of predicted toxin-antitoxin system
VRVLFDQGTPVPLRRFLQAHHVETAFERGWNRLANDALLEVAERERFQVLVTTDQNLRYQQNLAGRTIAVVALTSTSWPRIRQVVTHVREAVDSAQPGTIREVVIP